MKKIALLFFLAVFTGTMLRSQTTTTTPVVGNESLLQQIAALKDPASKVNDAYVSVQKAAASSRSAGVTASNNFHAACDAYLTVLKDQLTLAKNNKDLSTAIQREIDLVNKLESSN